VGLELDDVDFGLALVGDRLDTARSWMSLQATAGSIEFVGIEGLEISATDLAVTINKAAASDGSVIDYAQQNLAIAAGNGNTVTLDMDGTRGDLLEASGHLTVDAFGFFRVAGDFAVTKVSETVKLSDASTVNVDLLTIGASNVDAFAGINGGTADAIGLELEDVSFGIAMMREQLGTGVTTPARSWFALQAEAGRAGFVGVADLTVEVSAVSVQVNQADINGQVVDFKASPLDVAVGPGLSLTLDMDGANGALVRATGNFVIDAFGFFQAEGSLALEKTAGRVAVADIASTVGVDESGTIDVDLLTLGGSGLNAFVGINGGTADALGLAVGGVDFALVLASESGLAPGATPRSWSSLQATAESVGFIGVEGLQVSADTLLVQVNSAAADGTVIDYTALPLEVPIGVASTMTLDMNGANGAMLRASGHLTLDVFGFFQADGDFAIEKKTAQVTLADGAGVNVNLLTIGASNVDAFAGVNGGTGDALGFALSGVNVAVALMQEQGAGVGVTPRSWTALKATAGSAALIGIDGLTIAGENLLVEVNQAGLVTSTR
jgi:hypothetical protein